MKYILYFIISAIFLLTIQINAFANGTPIDISYIARTGHVKMIQQKSISIAKEELKIKFDADYANVSVKYYFDPCNEKETVSFGFPVDYMLDKMDYDEHLTNKKDIKEFHIYDDKKEIKSVESQKPDIMEAKIFKEEYKNKLARKWFLADINFIKNKSKVITIEYKIQAEMEDWYYADDILPSLSDRYFVYDFSPASNWGKGIIKNLKIEIDFTQNAKLGSKIKSLSLKGYHYAKNKYTYELNNADPSKIGNLIIKYDNQPYALTKAIVSRRITKENIVYIKSSPAISSQYPLQNLFDNNINTVCKIFDNNINTVCKIFDNNINTVCKIKGSGVGEWIELETKNYIITGIAIINGNTRNSKEFRNNSRIRKMKIDVKSSYVEDKSSFTATLKNRQFNELNKTSFIPFMDILVSFPPGYIEASKIRLTISDIFKGNKYKDVYISELIIWGMR